MAIPHGGFEIIHAGEVPVDLVNKSVHDCRLLIQRHAVNGSSQRCLGNVHEMLVVRKEHYLGLLCQLSQ